MMTQSQTPPPMTQVQYIEAMCQLSECERTFLGLEVGKTD